MKISCPSCAAKYSIADDKVENRLAKIRCRKCSTTIVIDGKVNPANVYAADASGVQAEQPSAADAASGPVAAAAATPAPAAGGGGEYSVDFGDNDQRNLTLADLVVAYNAGEVTAETYIWTEGMADWAALGEVPEVVEALQSGAAPAAPAAAPTPAAAAPFGGGAPNFGAAPAQAPWDQGGAQADAVRAATEPGRGATADLFGGFDQAGGESDSVATSAPGPALGSGLGSGPAADPATGARNESSVLFSLSALTAAKDTSRPVQSSGTSATREDSGLIDLKALTSQAEASAPAVDPMMATAPPLGFAPPLGASPLGGGLASAQLSVAPPPKKSKMGLFIGAGIAFGAVVIAIAIVVSSSKEAPPPPPTAAATAAPAPAPTPTPTADTTVAAKPPATGTAEGENGDKPPGDAKTKVSARPTGGYKKPVGGQPSKPTGGASPAPAAKPAPKPKSACGCPPGDLQCAMRCAAGG